VSEDLTVRLAGPEDMDAVFALRHDVFVLGQGVPEELERDEIDPLCDHAVALRGDAVVGTGRLVPGTVSVDNRLTPGPVSTIGRMAVADSERNAGVGALLLALLEQRARERGVEVVELHAQIGARRFYDRAGYQPEGDVYLEAGIEHLTMRKPLR
jgi:predicted GNAT family N-acyltransferase